MKIKKGTIVLIISCILIVIIGIISMPYIYKFLNTSGVDIKSNDTKEKKIIQKKK